MTTLTRHYLFRSPWRRRSCSALARARGTVLGSAPRGNLRSGDTNADCVHAQSVSRVRFSHERHLLAHCQGVKFDASLSVEIDARAGAGFANKATSLVLVEAIDCAR